MDIEKIMLKTIWKSEGHRKANAVLEKNKVGGLSLLDLKPYWIATVVKTVWYGRRGKHTDEQARVENP